MERRAQGQNVRSEQQISGNKILGSEAFQNGPSWN